MAEDKQNNAPDSKPGSEKPDATTTTEKKESDKAVAAATDQGSETKKSGTPNDEKSKEDKNSETKKPTSRRKRSDSKRSRSKRRGRPERERSEFEQRIIGIRRVTRVVSGGRRFSFSVAMVVGDGKGRVGVGLGKSTDTALAIDKAARDAKKNMIKVAFNTDNSIDNELYAKFKASIVEMRPAPGRGLVAGSSVRDVLELAGAQNISAKLLSRSKNKINNARCAIAALEPISKKARVSLEDSSSRNNRNRRRNNSRQKSGANNSNSK
jgi:small subunit ribosomal protein S5